MILQIFWLNIEIGRRLSSITIQESARKKFLVADQVKYSQLPQKKLTCRLLTFLNFPGINSIPCILIEVSIDWRVTTVLLEVDGLRHFNLFLVIFAISSLGKRLNWCFRTKLSEKLFNKLHEVKFQNCKNNIFVDKTSYRVKPSLWRGYLWNVFSGLV